MLYGKKCVKKWLLFLRKTDKIEYVKSLFARCSKELYASALQIALVGICLQKERIVLSSRKAFVCHWAIANVHLFYFYIVKSAIHIFVDGAFIYFYFQEE